MKPSRSTLLTLVCLCLCGPRAALGQWDVIPKAALPEVPYWWTVSERQGVDLIPLVWTNEIDGGSNGCCAVGASGRFRMEPATFWLGLGFGTNPDAGALAGFEAAAEIETGAVSFRSLHGRSGLSLFYPVWNGQAGNPRTTERLSLGVSTLWLYDERYLETIPFFDCPSQAPSVPCEQVETAYPWSDGQDNAVVGEVAWGRGDWGAPRLTGSLGVGVKAVGGEHGYVRAELAAEVWGRLREADWTVRLAGGWSSSDAPLQRRFLLYGADPVTRWLNPYLDAKGALFSDIPYVVHGGPHLRAYEATQALVKRYVSAVGEVSGGGESAAGFWGRLHGFFEVAWTPGIPERLGPEAIDEESSLIFDWRELLAGEDEPLGRFMARSLEVSKLGADAGMAITGGYRNVALAFAFPLWASEPAFANEPIGSGKKKALALRWTLTISFFPHGRPEQ